MEHDEWIANLSPEERADFEEQVKRRMAEAGFNPDGTRIRMRYVVTGLGYKGRALMVKKNKMGVKGKTVAVVMAHGKRRRVYTTDSAATSTPGRRAKMRA